MIGPQVGWATLSHFLVGHMDSLLKALDPFPCLWFSLLLHLRQETFPHRCDLIEAGLHVKCQTQIKATAWLQLGGSLSTILN